MRTAVFLPKKIGAFAHNLVQALLRFGQHASIISIWSQSAAPTNMHPGRQVLEIRIRHQLCVSSSLRRFGFVFGIVRGYIRRSDRDRIGVQNALLLFSTSTRRSVTCSILSVVDLHKYITFGESPARSAEIQATSNAPVNINRLRSRDIHIGVHSWRFQSKIDRFLYLILVGGHHAPARRTVLSLLDRVGSRCPWPRQILGRCR